MDNINLEIKTKKKWKPHWILEIIILLGLFYILSSYIFSTPFRSSDVTIHITTNDTLVKISSNLEKNNIIHYPFILKALVSIFSNNKDIHTGDYLFKKNASIFDISWQIAKGDHGILPIKVTFTEGMTNIAMADLLAYKISNFNKDLFLSDPRSKQGYLFPDTYFFFPLSTTDEILDEMTANFNKRISKVDISSSGKSLSDIIKMASILEKEANGVNDSSVISGILWKRIKLGMPLQVDAEPSTYKINGLPVYPISNPGLVSINSAIYLKDSPYLFYLHDKNGMVHYAVNFSEHRSNIARYLK